MEKISLTMEEAKRFDVIQMALRGEVSMSKAAEVLGVCLRQAYRIKKKIKEKGVKQYEEMLYEYIIEKS